MDDIGEVVKGACAMGWVGEYGSSVDFASVTSCRTVIELLGSSFWRYQCRRRKSSEVISQAKFGVDARRAS